MRLQSECRVRLSTGLSETNYIKSLKEGTIVLIEI
jgi:hypothetical protein